MQKRITVRHRGARHAGLKFPALVATILLQAGAAGATELYVAVNGNDAWSGRRATVNGRRTDGPFATLERARDELRRRHAQPAWPADGVTVCIRGGRYPVKQTFQLDARDSGTEAAPIVYRAFPGETPVFSGGAVLRGFQPVRDPAVRARLPAAARDRVMQVDLAANGVTNILPLQLGGFGSGAGFVPHPVMELFFDGAALPLARWPNAGWLRVAGVGNRPGEPGVLQYEGDRPSRWQDEPDARLYGYWFHDWADSYERVAAIDPAHHAIKLAPPHHRYGYRAGQRYFALNLLSELDRPGEWYLDRQRGTLYLYPPANPARAVVELSTAAWPFVRLENVAHVAWEGLTWECGAADGFIIRGGAQVRLAGCTIRRCAGTAVEIHGGVGHVVRSCNLYSLGRGGVVAEGGDRRTLTPGGHVIENCDIHDLSRIDHTYTPAVLLSGVGGRIAHNLLHDIPSSAIRLAGNDHGVEFNEIYRVVRESDDQGGLDMWGDPTYRGNVIRYNYWHHIGPWRPGDEPLACGQAGIRLDDAISGVRVEGNVFYHAAAGRLGFGGVQIHGGKDNVICGNLFADCRAAVSLSPWGDQRWRAEAAVALQSKDIDPALYRVRYPELARLAEDHDVNVLASNLVFRCGEFLRRDRGWNRLTGNTVTAQDPGFADAARGDFRCAGRAAPGVEPIPFAEIGLYVDAWRQTLPRRAVSAARAGQ